MDDHRLIRQIDELVAEERTLHERAAAKEVPATEQEKARERAIDVELDVLWDLLRQRRALRRAGHDPDEAVARDPSVVEGYRQ